MKIRREKLLAHMPGQGAIFILQTVPQYRAVLFDLKLEGMMSYCIV